MENDGRNPNIPGQCGTFSLPETSNLPRKAAYMAFYNPKGILYVTHTMTMCEFLRKKSAGPKMAGENSPGVYGETILRSSQQWPTEAGVLTKTLIVAKAETKLII